MMKIVVRIVMVKLADAFEGRYCADQDRATASSAKEVNQMLEVYGQSQSPKNHSRQCQADLVIPELKVPRPLLDEMGFDTVLKTPLD
jgi:hypothetical protein